MCVQIYLGISIERQVTALMTASHALILAFAFSNCILNIKWKGPNLALGVCTVAELMNKNIDVGLPGPKKLNQQIFILHPTSTELCTNIVLHNIVIWSICNMATRTTTATMTATTTKHNHNKKKQKDNKKQNSKKNKTIIKHNKTRRITLAPPAPPTSPPTTSWGLRLASTPNNQGHDHTDSLQNVSAGFHFVPRSCGWSFCSHVLPANMAISYHVWSFSLA